MVTAAAMFLADANGTAPWGRMVFGSFLILLGGVLFVWGLRLDKKARKLKESAPSPARSNTEIFSTILMAVGMAVAVVGSGLLLDAF